LSPSESDIRLTHKVRAAGELLNIPLEDHLIIAGRKFYSFHDMNMLRA
jgi:DNA repair protein RadC